jgi:hypothetical protein
VHKIIGFKDSVIIEIIMFFKPFEGSCPPGLLWNGLKVYIIAHAILYVKKSKFSMEYVGIALFVC